MKRWFLLLATLGVSASAMPAESVTVDEEPKGFKLEEVTRGTWSPDGKWLATFDWRDEKENGDNVSFATIKIWNAKTGQLKFSLGELKYKRFTAILQAFGFSPDGTILAVATTTDNGRQMQIWDVDKGGMTHAFDLASRFGSRSFDFSPDGKSLIVIDSEPDGDGALGGRLYDIATGKSLKMFRPQQNESRITLSVRFSRDGKMLATVASTGQITLWDTKTGRSITKFEGPKTFGGSVAFSPDGQTLASASPAGLRLWQLSTGKHTELAGDDTRLFSPAFHPSGKLLATVGFYPAKKKDFHVQLWSVKDGKLLRTWEAGAPRSFAFTPDGKALALLHKDGSVRQWDLESYLDGNTK